MEFKPSFHSIAGVTYRDDFDFEERYANVNECDPFYWHPLHLPEYCADRFEKLIRSRMGKHGRVKKVKKEKKMDQEVYSLHVPDIHVKYSVEENFGFGLPPHPEFVWNEGKDVEIETLSPYEQMINELRQDLVSHPSAPTIGYVPNIGPVAVYRQPISKSSRKIIKTLANAYKKPNHKSRKSEINKIVINRTTSDKHKKKKKHRHHRNNKTKTR